MTSYLNIKCYLNVEKQRYCYLNLDEYRIKEISTLISHYKLTPRQVQEVFRILGFLLETEKENASKLRWCIGVGTILLSVLKIGDTEIYHKIGKQNLELENSRSFFNKIEPELDDWWFKLCFTGKSFKKEDISSRNVEDAFRYAGFSIETGELIDLRDYEEGWGRNSNVDFKHLYQKIEEISSFSS